GIAQLFDLSTARPAEPGFFLASSYDAVVDDWRGDVCACGIGMEEIPAALSRRFFLSPTRCERTPIHRLYLYVDTDLLQQLRRHQRSVVQNWNVGRLHQDNRFAIVAGFLHELLRLVKVLFH